MATPSIVFPSHSTATDSTGAPRAPQAWRAWLSGALLRAVTGKGKPNQEANGVELPKELAYFAHDLNNLLTIVTGYFELATNELHGQSVQLREAITVLQSARSQLSSATFDSLSGALYGALAMNAEATSLLHTASKDGLSQISGMAQAVLQAASGRKTESSFALVSVARTVASLAKSSAREKGVEVTTSAESTQEVLATEPELMMVALNLVKNAVEALSGAARKAGQKLRPQVVLSVKEEAGRVCLKVEDNGPGIPADKLRSIFDDGVSSKGAENYGFGLASVRRIVAKNHGQIKVESTEGRGTTFTIAFPIPGQGGHGEDTFAHA